MKKKSKLERLVDQNDTSIAASTVFMLIQLSITILLLLVLFAAIIVDLIFNHTMTMSWSDIAVYIGACSSFAATGGLVKGWTNFSTYKYKLRKGDITESSPYSDDDYQEDI